MDKPLSGNAAGGNDERPALDAAHEGVAESKDSHPARKAGQPPQQQRTWASYRADGPSWVENVEPF